MPARLRKEHKVSTEAEPVDVHVGTRVRLARAIAQVSQADLAEAIGVTFQQVQKYESGHNRISASRLVMIGKKLGKSVGFFFEGLDGLPVSDGYDNESMDIVRLFNRLSPDQQVAVKAMMATIRPNYSKEAA